MHVYTSLQHKYNYTKAMDNPLRPGFRERPHTADWELEAWAPDLPGLFRSAAEGMLALMGAAPGDSCLEQRPLELAAPDPEGLLVAFLGEILFSAVNQGAYCRPAQISIEGEHLTASLLCTPIASLEREIKAVTWHKLAIHFDAGLYRTVIVFDV